MAKRAWLVSIPLVFLVLLTVVFPTRIPLPIAKRTPAEIQNAYGKLPLSFEENRGQTDKRVDFTSRAQGYGLFLTSTEAVMTLKGANDTARVLRMQLAGANAEAEASGLDELPGKANYYIGNDPKDWHTGVAMYEKVKYRNVYDGIDLVYYGNQRQLEYDLIVNPGAAPDSIALNFAGAGKIDSESNGDLVLHVDEGKVYKKKPVIYQEANGARQLIAGNYEMKPNGQIGFRVGDYDKSRPLIIDPVLIYSTFLGGRGGYDNVGNGDFPRGFAVDSEGNAHIGGSTSSLEFPIGTFHVLQGIYEAYAAKLNASGTALIYIDYFLGNRDNDEIDAIAIDSAGNAVLTGRTQSSNWPTTPGAFQRTPQNEGGLAYLDTFATKLNPTGGLIFSTLLSGNFNDSGFAIALDSSDNIYIGGFSQSTIFPTTANAYQKSVDGHDPTPPNDVFFSKLSADGSTLLYSTFLGGALDDIAYGIAVDADRNVYLTGYTLSTDFPTTPGAFQRVYHSIGYCAASCSPNSTCGNRSCYDGFVAKFDNAGHLVYSTYLGGDGIGGDDVGTAIAADASGNVYVGGSTGSANFPTTPGAFQTIFKAGYGKDLFVTKLNPSGMPVYSTFIGGSGDDTPGIGDLTLDSAGSVYIGGVTTSSDFPLVNPIQNFNAGGIGFSSGDVFVTKLNPKGSALGFSTYLGGCSTETAYGVRLDSAGNIMLSGQTASNAACTSLGDRPFPTTPGAFDRTGASSMDGFVTKISNPCSALSLSPDTLPDVAVGANYNQTVAATGGTAPNAFVIASGSLPPGITLSASGVLSGSPTQTGTYNFALRALDDLGCAGLKNYSISVTAAADTTPPTITLISRTSANAAGWNNTAVTVTWSCSDSGSGVIEPTIVKTIPTEGRNQSLTGVCTDAAGNTASNTVSGINIDRTPPAVSFGAQNPLANAAGWNNTDVSIPFTGTDDLSGLDSASSTTSPLLLSSEGESVSASVTLVDIAGNRASYDSRPVKIDKTAPAIAGSQNPQPNANGWNDTSVTVSFACNDALSGIGSCTDNRVVTTEGDNQYVSGVAIDRAGNSTSLSFGPINIRKAAPPVITGLPAPGTCTLSPPNHNMITVASVTVSGSMIDSFKVIGTSNEPDNGLGDGDTSGDISISGTNPITVALRAERSAKGSGRIYTLTAIATDRSGNSTTQTSTCVVPLNQGKK